MNKRRGLVVLAGTSVFVPRIAFCQQEGKLRRVGFLSFRGRPDSLERDFYGGFTRGMRELGYAEGKNLVIEWRFAAGSRERLEALARELVQMKVDVIVTAGTLPTRAAKEATSNIPIVMGAGVDPVASGLVSSLARPGGNVTGLSNLASDLRPKHLEMLRSVMPTLSRVAILVNSAGSDDTTNLRIFENAVRTTGVVVVPAVARTPQDMGPAFEFAIQERAQAVIVTLNPLFVQQAREIAQLAMKHHLPSIAPNPEYVEIGGLMSYGQDQANSYRRAAGYVDKIFKGSKPSDLPVQQPMTFELVVNLKTAKALGLTMPPEIMVQATRMIK